MGRSIEQVGAQGDKTDQQSDPDSKKPYNPQLRRLHFHELPQPSLHCLGKCEIRQPFKYENQTNESEQKFHKFDMLPGILDSFNDQHPREQEKVYPGCIPIFRTLAIKLYNSGAACKIKCSAKSLPAKGQIFHLNFN